MDQSNSFIDFQKSSLRINQTNFKNYGLQNETLQLNYENNNNNDFAAHGMWSTSVLMGKW